MLLSTSDFAIIIVWRPSVCLSVSLSVCLCLYVCLSVCISTYPRESLGTGVLSTDKHCWMVMQSADWVVFNTHQQLELMRVTCGGWRRPFAFNCTSPSRLVFTYHQPRIGTTHVHCRGPARPRLTPTPAHGGVQAPPATPPSHSTARPDSAADFSSALERSSGDHGRAAQIVSEGNSAGGVDAQQGNKGGIASGQETSIGTEDRHGTSEPVEASVGRPGSQGGGELGGGGEQGGGGEPVTSLHAVHHGREVLCCALLPSVKSQHMHQTDRPSSHSHSFHSNSSSSDSRSLLNPAPELASSEQEGSSMQLQDASPLCLLSGSEDGTIRQLLYSPPTPSKTHLQTPSETPSETPSGTPQSTPSQLPNRPTIPSAAQSSADSMKSPPASPGRGRSVPVSSTTDEGQTSSSKRQQGKAVRGSFDRQQKGLYGADEVGFQAAGSAVKSIVVMSLGVGRHSLGMHLTLLKLILSQIIIDA